MDSLYLLVPMSVLLVLTMIGIFGWALHRGQFDDLAIEGERMLLDDGSSAELDGDQTPAATTKEE
jgi:cbb3-type cytochrome oxidase maturation protein